MPSDEEGSKGIKRKSEESAKESANKHSCPGDGGSTSTGITHGGQAEGNVEKINWMKCCNVNVSGVEPQCTICGRHYPLYIDPTTLKDHLNEKHPQDIYIKENELEEDKDWIFRYYRPVSGRYIRCNFNNCKKELETAKFKGQFVDHFDEEHEREAEQRFQRDNEDPKVAKERLTIQFVLYLHNAFKNKGNENKKKYEKSEEAEGNVRKLNWMKCCKMSTSSARPRCDICQKYKLLHIDSGNFKDHLKEMHQILIDEENEPDWIFDHYTSDDYYPRNIACKLCKHSIEVSKFSGPFVEHFDQRHDEEAERRNEGGYEDVEQVERLTEHFVTSLYTAFRNKAIHDVRYKAWWMEHAKKPEDNKITCDITNCPQYMKIFKVRFTQFNFKEHVQFLHPDVQLRRNVYVSNYILIDNYLLRCKICDEILTYYLETPFKAHLSDVHNINCPRKADKTIRKINKDEAIIDYDKQLIQYLVENYKIK